AHDGIVILRGILDLFSGTDEEEHRHRLREKTKDDGGQRPENVMGNVTGRRGEPDDARADQPGDGNESGDEKELCQAWDYRLGMGSRGLDVTRARGLVTSGTWRASPATLRDRATAQPR